MWGDQYVPGLHLPPPANASYRGMTEAKAQAQRVTQSWCTLHWQTISACDRWHFHCVKASETTAARQRAQFQSKSSSFHRRRNSFDIFFFLSGEGIIRVSSTGSSSFDTVWHCIRTRFHQHVGLLLEGVSYPGYTSICSMVEACVPPNIAAICDLWTHHSKNRNRLSARFENVLFFFTWNRKKKAFFGVFSCPQVRLYNLCWRAVVIYNTKMSVNVRFIKLLKNRRLTPFPLPEDEFGFPFLVFWCVMFQQRKHEQCNTAWKPVITLRHVLFF